MKIYVQNGYVIGEAVEPYLQCFDLMDAPDGIPLDKITINNGEVVVTEDVPSVPVFTVPTVMPLSVTVPESKQLMDVVKERLLGQTLDTLDYKLLLLSVTVLSLYNLGTEPDLLAVAMEKLGKYVNTTD